MVRLMDITNPKIEDLKIKANKFKKIIFDRTQPNLQIIQFTPDNSKNPYFTMVGDELIKRGIDFKYIDNFQKIMEIIEKKPTIIHFHQLSPFYHANNKENTLIKAYQLLDNIKHLKDHGGKIVYTMHNPLPHNRIFTDIDKIINKEMYILSNHIIVLGPSAKETILKNERINTPITAIKHVSFREFYGKKPNKQSVKRKIGLPTNSIIFGNIGSIKPYKGLEFIIKSFIKLSESQNYNKKLHLLIAGYAHDTEYITSLKENYTHKDITIINQDLNNTELIEYISTLDYSIFAFNDIWASGSVVLSISYGIPVIVPDIGCMADYVKHSKNGYLYKSNDQNSLIHTLNHTINSNNTKHLKQMCNEYPKKHTIKKSSQEFIEIYKQIINENPNQTKPYQTTNNQTKTSQNKIHKLLTKISRLLHKSDRTDKKVVYTAITGNYDELITPEYVNNNWDYICFTDNLHLTSDFWQIRRMEELDLDHIKKARRYKILPHQYLPEYENSLWIDGNYKIIGNIDNYIEKYSLKSSMMCLNHPDRDCIYQESDMIVELKKDSEKIVSNQINRYITENYPKNHGMIASGIIYRKHNDPIVKDLMNEWWSEIESMSHRDQLSFNYVCWKKNFQYDISNLNCWKNEYFKHTAHKNKPNNKI